MEEPMVKKNISSDPMRSKVYNLEGQQTGVVAKAFV
jgi:hypothetical protein